MGTENSEVLRGTLDLLILKTLHRAPLHGWGICERIQQVSGDTLRVQQGSLYASLHRLTREGWIRSSWAETENGRRARYYALTRAGVRQLEVETLNWHRLSTGVARVLAAAT
jgi:transcriptional regulator